MADAHPDHSLIEVRLLQIPLAIHREAREHQDDLEREFALIAQSADPQSVPPRLLTLVREVRERFRGFSEGTSRQIDEALAAGESSVDITFRIPHEAVTAAGALARMLSEADAYCVTGESLLTLAAPGRVVAYREWFLGEFARQAAGGQPLPWPDYMAGASSSPGPA